MQDSRNRKSTSSSSDPHFIFLGHVSIDRVENVNGARTQAGGAALYAAIAAKVLNVKTSIVSAIGKDFPFPECFDGVDSTSIRTFDVPTTRFYIRYNKNWEANYVEFKSGAGAKITSALIPSKLLKQRSVIHLSPMKPAAAANILNSVKRRSPEARVAVSTWIGYLKTRKGRRTVEKLASEADFFMLNEFEAKALTQTNSLSSALEKIECKKMVVTMGKLGAIISGTDIEPQMVPALSIPPEKVVDTTGAGDTWNGAFIAAYATTDDLMKSVTVASIISSIKCSQWGFEAIRKLSFQRPSDVVAYVLALKEGWMQKKITDFICNSQTLEHT